MLVTLTLSDVPESEFELALERVLELVRQGYTSGIEPCWNITERDEEHANPPERASVYEHIDNAPDKTAQTLQHMATSISYNTNIKRGAERLIVLGREDWVYQTQWGGGMTLWASPDKTKTCTVATNGSVRD